ncbi:MAG: FAD-dependent oxidoreductase, partial [Planctomycetota bacterium]
LSLLDYLNARTYPDTIARAKSNLDTHGYTIEPYLTLRHPGTIACYVPYRCLLPKGLEGLLVIGLGLSAHRDAIPIVRMQADLQNLGYAAGVAAAMAAEAGGTRAIDVRRLQQHLVDKGCLPAEVLGHEDSYPLPPERISRAVHAIPDGYQGAAVVLSHREQALPLLRQAYRRVEDPGAKLAYAHVLGVLGDATGIETLIEAVEAAEGLGDGYEYRGMGHDHSRRRMSQTDSLLLALGRTGDRRATPAVLRKLALLGPQAPFSHHWHVAAALEALGDPRAAKPLADLLARPGMSGHAIETVGEAIDKERPPLGNATRLGSFREIVLARALYRCGDHDGLARRILQSYTKDLRGHFARHAAAVLRSRGGSSGP